MEAGAVLVFPMECAIETMKKTCSATGEAQLSVYTWGIFIACFGCMFQFFLC